MRLMFPSLFPVLIIKIYNYNNPLKYIILKYIHEEH